MGILNVTPDSFSDGGRHDDVPRAVAAALAMIAAGADLIDIGGESTRPGSTPVPADVELSRVVPVIAALSRETTTPLSIDTTKAVVARAAVEAGAVMINDVSGLRREPALAGVAADTGAALVLMHMRGAVTDMYAQATYDDVIGEVVGELAWSVDRATEAGVPRGALMLDPGIGFAKRAEHSWEIVARLADPRLLAMDLPILVGASRKSFLQTAIGETPAAGRDAASVAVATVAALSGAHVLRVHDVAGSVQAARVADMISAAAAASQS